MREIFWKFLLQGSGCATILAAPDILDGSGALPCKHRLVMLACPR